MPPTLPSARFARIYESLPREAQIALVEKQLIPLLDVIPKDKSKKVISAATRLQTQHSGVPVLDLKGKKKEINGLLDGLNQDSKRAFLRERSNKDELLAEVVESLVDWLSDIWNVVYEHNVNFALAHSCLIFTADVLDHISNTRGECKCSIMSMFVNVTIKRKSGAIVKFFSLTGAHNIDSVLLWIWRDLFVSLSATTHGDRKLIPEMLADIEVIMGWQALERLLYGGKKSLSDEDDEEDEDEDEAFFDKECCEDEDDSDEASDFCCPCPYHSSHWSSHVNSQRVQLRECVQERLKSIFRISPSMDLYSSIMSISVDTDDTMDELRELLKSAATSCSDNFAAALDIHASENNAEDIIALLDSHSHLLRPRDTGTLQSVAGILSDSPFFQPRGLQIVEKELLGTARAIHTALLSCFGSIDEGPHKEELDHITTLQVGSPARQDHVGSWVDAVVNPGSQPPNPMNFAALLMGLPLPLGLDDTDEGDALGYLDVDQNDPDLEDLREEYRPKLKERFDAWNEWALSFQGGPTLLIDVYAKLTDLMPFLRAPDVVDEMIGRLADKPGKHHICDALDALSVFGKLQRKKILLRDKKRKMEAQKVTARTSTQQLASSFPNGSTGFTFVFGSSIPSSSSIYSSGIGGMEDVD